MNGNGFPRELLSRPLPERVAYFEQHTVGHPLLSACYEELLYLIRDVKPGSLVFLYGNSGVGKTTLLARLYKQTVDESLPELEADPGLLPVVSLEAPSPESGPFNWKDFFIRYLIKLNEPLVERKLDMEMWDASGKQYVKILNSPRSPSAKYRHATEQALEHRRPKVVLIDEAQHLANVGSGRKLLDQLNTIKSLANLTRTTHVLCGTYELLTLQNLNGQLSRRSVDVHLPRYDAGDARQRQQFINVLWTFQNHLPVEQTPDLVSKWEYFYERSLGCVGILKDWLTLSFKAAARGKKAGLSQEHFERNALPLAKCERLISEALEGERHFIEAAGSRARLRSLLRLDIDIAQKRSAPSDERSAAAKKKPVGVRKPVRDPVGGRKAE